MPKSSGAGLTLTLAMVLGVASTVAPENAQAQASTPNRELAKLQQQLAASPNSVKALQAIGYKLYELERFPEARPILEQARQLDPKCGPCALYAGLTAEKLKDFTAAKAAYTKYLDVGRTPSVKKDVRTRLIAMAKDELAQSAKAAVANETALRGVQAPGNTVAVLPFKCSCPDSLLPLERGMAELVVTDLSRSSSLRVLERDRMQAIADEIQLSSRSQVDATTATRAGKLISAGRILNGSIVATGGQTVNLTGAVVNTANANIDGNPAASGTLSAIFRAEKDFVTATFRALNVTLSPAELKEFDKTPTQNLQAFLAFSRGLMAEDAGRLDDAARFFESARTMDPGFSAALQKAQSSAAAAGSQLSSVKVEQGLKNSSEGSVVTAASRGSTSDAGLGNTLNNVVGDVNPTTTNTAQSAAGGSAGGSTTPTPKQQNTVSQATGGDQPALRTGQVTIVIKKP